MILFLISSILGFGIVGLLPKSINNWLKFLVAPALGLFLFTEIAIFVSFIFGIDIISLTFSLAFEAIIAILVIKYFGFPTLIGEKLSRIFTISLLVIVIPCVYILFSQVLFLSKNGYQAGGGGMYGDTALHLAYTSRMETGEFPPQNPLYAGKILVYPFANDLLSAFLRINGLGINLAFVLPQIFFLIGFVSLFYALAKKFTSDSGYLISILIFSLGSGAGFVYFIRDILIKNPAAPFVLKEYTDNVQYNLYLHNVFTGLILPERSFLPGLFIGIGIFLNFFEFFKTNNKFFLLVNGFLIGALPFWHTHTFIFIAICSVIFSYYFKNILLKNAFYVFLSLVIALIVALPFFHLFFLNKSTGSFLHFVYGWQKGSENILIFWLKNSYLTIPLALIGFVTLRKDLKPYFLGAFVAFLVANFISFQPWSWDNIKLFSWSFLFFSILCGFILANSFKKKLWIKVLVVFIIFTSCVSGLLSIFLQFKDKYIIYDNQDIELANWAKNNTGKDEIFLIEPVPNHPIVGLAGRLVYLGYPGHLWVHGIDYYKRDSLNTAILDGNLNITGEAEVPITYLVLPVNFSANSLNTRVLFENNKYQIIRNEI